MIAYNNKTPDKYFHQSFNIFDFQIYDLRFFTASLAGFYEFQTIYFQVLYFYYYFYTIENRKSENRKSL